MSKDTIYREDAIKAIEELPNAYNGWSDAYDKAYIISTLEEVPSSDRLSEMMMQEEAMNMSNEQAVQILIPLRNMMCDQNGCPISDAVFALDKAIEVLSADRPQEWIPCSERLPKIGEHHISEPCIVYCKGGVYAFAELEENIFGQVGWNCERDDDYHEPIGEVVAWMPLPQPWKGADDEYL